MPIADESRSVERGTPPPQPHSQAWINVVEDAADRLAASRVLVLGIFTLVFTAVNLYLAKLKPFWDDEFFTLYLVTTSGWDSLLAALATGADQHPPSYYYLLHGITGLLGVNNVSLRLTSILGLWLMCVCIYEIAGRLTSKSWAAVALVMPLSSGALYYATEARGYGMVAGFAALALLCWILAAEGVRRAITIPLLAASLAVAVGHHYYAIFILGPLGLGELVRSIQRRRIDLPVWVSFAGAAVPIVLFIGTIRSARTYSGHFWAKPVWSKAVNFLSEYGYWWLAPILAGLVVAALTRFFPIRSKPAAKTIPLWQTCAFVGLAVLPFAGVMAGKLVTNGFTSRYAIPAVIGFVLLITLGFANLTHHRTAFAAVMTIVCAGTFAVHARELQSRFKSTLADMRAEIPFLRTASTPILLTEVTVFHRLSFYAPHEFAEKLVFGADPALSVKYERHDTVDRGLLDLKPWFPINVVPLRDFLLNTPSFSSYGYVGPWSWLTYELPKMANQVRLLDRYSSRILMSVDEVVPSTVLQRTSGYKGTETLPTMYSEIWKDGDRSKSLCERYMGPGWCPVLR